MRFAWNPLGYRAVRGRIERAIKQAQEEGRVAFIGLVPIDPQDMATTRKTADMLIASGVDIVMIHIPNRFPWMEGAVLQTAARFVWHAGITREEIFAFIKELRSAYPEIPLVDMTLYDTAVTMGEKRFFALSEEADVDGFDLPNCSLLRAEHGQNFYTLCLASGRHLILAISYELAMAPEATEEYARLCQMVRMARGFVFVMNAPGGQSGSAVKLSDEELRAAVQRVKAVMAREGNPCYVAIVCGISGQEDVERVKRSGAESFMIGSAYIKDLQDGKPVEDVAAYIRSVRAMCCYEAR